METPNASVPKPAYCYKATAIRILGLTPGRFDKLGLVPAKTVPNPHHRSTEAQLFDRAKIERLVSSRKVAALRPKARRTKPKRPEPERPEPEHPKDYPAIFRCKYGSPQAALLDACRAMFNLNRYCKHPWCLNQDRTEIYGLKNRLIRILYQGGYSTEVCRHEIRHPPQKCRDCNGKGKYPFRWDDDPDGVFDDDEDEVTCDRCDGTGIWRGPRSTYGIAFRFNVKGEHFSWHQPEELIGFPVSMTEDEASIPEIEAKPLEIPLHELTEAKELVAWVVSGWEPNEETKTNRAA